jgi:hypothetical protein
MATLIQRNMGDLRRWQLQNVKKEKGWGGMNRTHRERERERESEERYFTLRYMVRF